MAQASTVCFPFFNALQSHLLLFFLQTHLLFHITEVTYVYNGTIFTLDLHLDRMFKCTKIIGLDIGKTREEITKLANELVAHNNSWFSTGIIYMQVRYELFFKFYFPHHNLSHSCQTSALEAKSDCAAMFCRLSSNSSQQ